ncbi:MAG TPA: DNA gyrase subunit A [Candidatus Andersenbacteria bacterium]|nr:MAG: DNA gyrase subunit A [Candidatus Andersenbacteria bacterium RIFCSPHIGHO2_02_FULL_46_16]HBE89728.1 DNA gyrase subunit A [Candidatus Andersenbacteria bacterium]
MSSKSSIGSIIGRDLSEEIQQSYLDYAMSVIVSRALPDVRDGMKPVARRILFSMWQQGLRSTAKFRKSANVVGDVLGKYHPHSDTAVYDALARLAQDFSLRYELIEGQGNWGSLDGDAPAAMRYTEARLSKVADEMMINIEKDTVDFTDNYDGTRHEPVVLPSALPNFIINGTLGIAVGMATTVPPHNLTEVCDAAIHLIDHPNATVEDLIQFVKGPDFPTGGAIYDQHEILRAYATGKGSIVTRALADIEEDKGQAFRIIVREIPYLVNKSVLVAKIAESVKTKKIEGIRDLRDESDKDGVRIVIELKKDAYPRKVLNRLFAITDLQKTFHVNMLALVDQGRQPKVLSLKEVLEEHIKHRQVVITRRTKFDLDRAKERAHILEGLKKALDHINEIISTIRKSRTKETAHENLRKNFTFSAAQATAILEMRLQTLAGLERQKVEDELAEKKKLITELAAILNDPKKVLTMIRSDYRTIKENYGDARRTRVFKQSISNFSQEDLIPDDPTVIIVTRGGYIKRLATSAYRVQNRGGQGVKGMATKEEDIVDTFLATTTHKDLLFFTNLGRVFTTKAYEIPATTRAARGQALPNFLELAQNERVTAVQALPSKDENEEYLVMATRQGIIKKTSREDFTNIRRSGLKAITLKDSDTLEWVSTSTGKDAILLTTASGQAIHFSEKDVRPMGRTAAGVHGMKLKSSDNIVTMHVIPAGVTNKPQVLVITEQGYGKRTPLADYRLQHRGGTGIKTAHITAKTGRLVQAAIINKQNLTTSDLLIISEKGQVIRINSNTVSQQSRATQGVKVMKPTAQSGCIATFTTWTD